MIDMERIRGFFPELVLSGSTKGMSLDGIRLGIRVKGPFQKFFQKKLGLRQYYCFKSKIIYLSYLFSLFHLCLKDNSRAFFNSSVLAGTHI